MAAAGLVCVLYDHVLTFEHEWAYMWRLDHWDYTRVVFFATRYGNEAGLLLVNYSQSRVENSHWRKLDG